MSVLNQVPAGGPTVPPGGMEMSEFYKGHWVSQETSQPTIVQAFGVSLSLFLFLYIFPFDSLLLVNVIYPSGPFSPLLPFFILSCLPENAC